MGIGMCRKTAAKKLTSSGDHKLPLNFNCFAENYIPFLWFVNRNSKNSGKASMRKEMRAVNDRNGSTSTLTQKRPHRISISPRGLYFY